MKSLLGWILIVAFTIIFSSTSCADLVPYDAITMTFPISPEQAMQAARDWANDPALDVSLLGVNTFPNKDFYVLATPDDTERYSIDCETGRLGIWVDFTGEAEYSQKKDILEPADMLSTEQLNALVEQFLSDHYPDFAALNLQHINTDTPGSGYAQRLANGVWNPARGAACTIDEWTGQIYRYAAWYGNLPAIATDPTVSASEAEQTALDSCSYLELVAPTDDDTTQYAPPQSAFVLKNWGVFLDEDELGAQRVVWIIDLVVSLDPAYTAYVYQSESTVEPYFHAGEQVAALVDAQTGEWVGFMESGPAGGGRRLTAEEAAGNRAHRVKPPTPEGKDQHDRGTVELDGIAIADMQYPVRPADNALYIYARYLPLAYGGTLEWRRGTVQMTVAGKVVELTPGSADIKVDGKRICLAHPVKIIAGRTYVPQDAIEAICGAEATWDAQSKVLSIKSRDIPRKILQRAEAISSKAR